MDSQNCFRDSCSYEKCDSKQKARKKAPSERHKSGLWNHKLDDEWSSIDVVGVMSNDAEILILTIENKD